MGNRITMTELAELAGVSKITVSRALRNSELVRADLRKRINDLATEHGYRLNVAARNLRLRRTHVVTVVVEMLSTGERPMSDPILLHLLGGLLDKLAPAGYDVNLTTRDHLSDTGTLNADGVILIGQGRDQSMLERIEKFGIPTAVWGSVRNTHGFTVVGSDNVQGGRLAAAHLIDGGRRRIVFLGDTSHPEVHDRFEGVRDVLSSSEAALVARLPCEFTRGAARKAIQAFVATDQPIDAIIAASDIIAAGAFDGLKAAGIAPPAEVAVIGFDDSRIAAEHSPPLSSIRQNWQQGGRLLASTLLKQLDGEKTESVMMGVDLVIRETTIPVR